MTIFINAQSFFFLLDSFRPSLSIISIIQLVVNISDESSGSSLSSLVFLLFFRGSGLGDTSLSLKGQFSSLSVIFSSLFVHSSNSVKVWVQGFSGSFTLQGVSLDGIVNGDAFLSVSNNRLNGIGVDDLGNIRVSQDSSVEVISVLLDGTITVGTEDSVKGFEGRFSPDDESSKVTTGSQLSQVESVNIGDFNSGDVSDSSEEVNILVAVDEEGASSESVSLVSELTLTSSDDLGFSNSFNIIIRTDSSQESNGISGLFNAFDLVINNQRKVGNIGNSVASGEDKRSHS